MDGATKQRDSISAPSLAKLEDEARALLAHQDFDRALTAFCDGMISSYTGRRLANIGLGHTLGWVVSVLIIYLNHIAPEGTTSAQLINLCTAGGLAGAKAVKGAIRVLLSFGLVSEEAHATDRRAKRLRPTQLLLDIHSENIVARLTALEIIQTLPMPASKWGRERNVMLAFFGGNIEALAQSGFRLYDGFPEIRAFMDRTCGYLILLDLLNSVVLTTDGAPSTTALPSAIAARFDVSPAHVRKLLAMAQNEGWLKFEPKRYQILMESTFHLRLRHWVALEFVWTWRLVRPNR
jgi:hypothetical protein